MSQNPSSNAADGGSNALVAMFQKLCQLDRAGLETLRDRLAASQPATSSATEAEMLIDGHIVFCRALTTLRLQDVTSLFRTEHLHGLRDLVGCASPVINGVSLEQDLADYEAALVQLSGILARIEGNLFTIKTRRS